MNASPYDWSTPSYLTPKDLSASTAWSQEIMDALQARKNATALNIDPIASTSTSKATRAYNLGGLLDQIAATAPVKTTETTATTKQAPSAALESVMAAITDNINKLGQDTATAYANKFGTYDDLIRSLSDRYMTTGSAAATNAINTALASGLTPSEAQGLSNEALMKVLQEYNPALAGLTAEQADVNVKSQEALAGLLQNLELPFVRDVMSPYLLGVAGQTQTGRTLETDPLTKLNALINATGMMEQSRQSQTSNALGIAQLQQAAEQFAQNMGLRQQELGMRGMQFNQQLAANKALAELQGTNRLEIANAEAMLRNLMQQEQFKFMDAQRIAKQQDDIARLERVYDMENLNKELPKNSNVVKSKFE